MNNKHGPLFTHLIGLPAGLLLLFELIFENIAIGLQLD
jgi:hypothetical protein